MQITSKSFRTGTLSFIIVLLFMPLGHALMVLNEKLIPEHKFLGAAILGFTSYDVFCWITIYYFNSILFQAI
tara:strand:+ start:150 stop:365 length:216 start_codon:yes stop_codon:yes gene_type:complete